jgi:cephalosporin hydroxylase
MYTREEFEQMRSDCAGKMAKDEKLKKQANEMLVAADKFNWIHQTNWFGEPILQLPQDMFALQEIIFRTRPKYIIEVGVAWAGSLLFYSTILKALGGGKIIGIDIYIPEDLKARIAKFGSLTSDIELITGSSIDEKVFQKVRETVGDSGEVLVVLDSNHTHEHVLQELQMYSKLVGKGYYLICGDTIVEDIPPQTHRPRPWGPGNSPKTALFEFLKNNDQFENDTAIENKLLLTCNPAGFLVRK